MDDVAHSVVAVGSRSVESAQKFIQEYAKGDTNIRAYGTYDEVFADPVSSRNEHKAVVPNVHL